MLSPGPSLPIRAPLAAAVALVLAGWMTPATSQTEVAHARLVDGDPDSQPAVRRGKHFSLEKSATGSKPVRLKGDPTNILYSEDFSNCGQNPPVPAPPPAPYPAPLGLTVHNVDGLTPNSSVSYVTSAWIVREDFASNTSDCVIFSTSWYSPAGAANDWVVLPQITPLSNTQLSWNAVTYDASYRDGYEVRVSTASDAVADFLVNPALFSIAAEASTWTSRSLPLGDFAGTPIRIAFRNNSNDKFLLLLDDLVIENVVQFDPILLTLAEPRFEYAQVPAFLGYQYALPATVQNGGAQALTEVVVSADLLLDGAPSGSLASDPIPNLPSGAVADAPVGLISFNQPGAWSVDAIVSAFEGDDVPNNSVQAADLTQATTQSLRRFEDPNSGPLGIGAGNSGEMGSEFTIPAAGKLAAAQVAMVNADQSDPPDGIPDFEGRSFRMLLREFDMNAMTPGAELASSTTVFPTGLPLDSVVELTFDFGSQVLSQGRYVLTIEEPVEPTPITLAVTTHDDRFTPGTQWVIWPTSPFGGWANIETFGASFAKSLGITALFDALITVPVAADDVFAVDEDGELAGDVRPNDTPSDDGGNVWSLVDDVSNGSLAFSNGTFTYTPAPDYNGPDTFTYQLCDVDLDCDSATVSITVNPVNDLPVAVDDGYAVGPDGTLDADVSLNDAPSPDGGNVWAPLSQPSSGTLDFSPNGSFSYTAAAGFAGSVSFEYNLCDIDNDCDQAQVTIDVLPTLIFRNGFE